MSFVREILQSASSPMRSMGEVPAKPGEGAPREPGAVPPRPLRRLTGATSPTLRVGEEPRLRRQHYNPLTTNQNQQA